MTNTNAIDPSGSSLRRRGSALEDAIFEATAAELGERGYANTTIKGIAQRAGTGKAVLYRRWKGVPELVLDLMKRRALDIEAHDTGDLREDLMRFMKSVRALAAQWPRDTVAGLVADTAADPRLAGLLSRYMNQPQVLKTLQDMLDRAAARGQIRTGPFDERVVLLPLTLLRHDLILRSTMPTDTDLAQMLDSIVLPLLRE